jgi:hypothetical protein
MEEKILAAIEALGKRQSALEISMNELITGHMENAALIEALIEAVRQAPQAMMGGLKVNAPPDLDLTSWLEEQKKKDEG